MTSGPLRVTAFVLLWSFWLSDAPPVSSPSSASPPPDSASAAAAEVVCVSASSGSSDKSSTEQLLLELDSASDCQSASGPESSAEELESPPR